MKRTYLPLQEILRIDEVEKRGKVRITQQNEKNNISHLPPSFYLHKERGDKK